MPKLPLYTIIFFLGAGVGGFFWLLSNAAGLPITLDNPPRPMSFSSSAQCPFFIKANPAATNPEDIANTTVTFPPEAITTPVITVNNHEQKFDVRSKTFDGQELVQFPGQPLWDQRQADVDGDGQSETIFTGNTAMNHTPHIVVVVKQGKVIFKAFGTSLGITDIHSGTFILNRTNDWLTGDTEQTFYRWQNNDFVPVWKQKSCGIQITQ